jgi:hypothetical protein
MSDQIDKTIEKSDASKPDSSQPLSSKGIDSVRGEEQAIQDDYTKYLEQLYGYRARMQKIGNLQAVEETNDEIEKIDGLLDEMIKKKNRIMPNPGGSTSE